MSYDIESLKTIEEKERLLKEALEGNYILVFQHDEHHECCTLEMTPKGIRAKEKFEFSIRSLQNECLYGICATYSVHSLPTGKQMCNFILFTRSQRSHRGLTEIRNQ